MSSIPRHDNPFTLFAEWFAEAHETEPKYPDAVSLATVGEDGMPSVRTVLIKEWDERGFVFYTNLNSHKGRDLRATRRAALCFYWKSRDRQIRIRGPIEIVSDAQADNYFNTRPLLSRLGAWASHQSEEITGREQLMARLEEVKRRFADSQPPRPPHWTGVRVIPNEIEFWKEGDYRLHDRLVYTRAGEGWTTRILSP
jgi:pyridoxamine 5'-phosphate oxidase